MSAISSEAPSSCYPSCDWLQHSRTPHKLGPVLSSPHALPAAAPQPGDALCRGFELAHGDNSTNFLSICCCVTYGCGLRVCLRRPLGHRKDTVETQQRNNMPDWSSAGSTTTSWDLPRSDGQGLEKLPRMTDTRSGTPKKDIPAFQGA